jgi:hypothetical protein
MLVMRTPLRTTAPFPSHGDCGRIGLRNASSGQTFTLILSPSPKLVLKDIFPIHRVLLHYDELAVVYVAEVLKILDGKVIPFHQEDT